MYRLVAAKIRTLVSLRFNESLVAKSGQAYFGKSTSSFDAAGRFHAAIDDARAAVERC